MVEPGRGALLENVIRLPFGDQSGSNASRGGFVTARAWRPSAVMTKIRALKPPASNRPNAIDSPSGETEAKKSVRSSLVLWTIRVRAFLWVPSARIFQIAQTSFGSGWQRVKTISRPSGVYAGVRSL